MNQRFEVNMEDTYRITVCLCNTHVLVENLSVPDSCSLNVHKIEDDENGEIKAAFDANQWETFICKLIEYGYLA